MNNEVAVRASVEAEISGFEMKPRTLKEAMDFCELMANSDLVPTTYKGKPGNIMVAIQMGNELSLSPMRALRCIAVINGRASMWGDELLAMVKASPVCEWVHEQESTEECGVCEVKRKDDPKPLRSTFTLADAKRAGLLGKAGPWQQYTKRMLTLRARGFALRDQFPDVLAGLVSTEEALDMPAAEAEAQESAPVLTLKDKLKAQVAQPETPVLEPTTAEMLAKIEAKSGPVDEYPRTYESAPPPPVQKGSVLEPAVEEMMEDLRQADEAQQEIRTLKTLTPISLIIKDVKNAPDDAAKIRIINEALALPYSQSDKALLIKEVKGVKK